MSRSRRKVSLGKCSSGHGFVPYADIRRKGKLVGDCPILFCVHEHNEQFWRYKERRFALTAEENDDDASDR